MKRLLILSIVLAVVVTTGCQNTLYFATGTQFGIEINAAEGGRQTAKIGYHRMEGVVMPLRRTDEQAEEGGKLKPAAYPVLSIFDLESGTLLLAGLGTTKVRQVFATGRAAVQEKSVESVNNTMRALAGVPIPDTRDQLSSEDLALNEAYGDWISDADNPDNFQQMKLWLVAGGDHRNPVDLYNNVDAIPLLREANKKFNFSS